MTHQNPPSVRGFVIERQDGQAQLPGSLHTNRKLSQWVNLHTPGQIEILTGKAELGQGILTALRLLAAEELDVDLAQISLISASTLRGPDEGVTSGSLSVQDSGGAIRHACAHLRGLALQQAASQTGVPSDAITVHAGVLHAADGRALGDYWQLLKNSDLDIEYDGQYLPKEPHQRRLLGKSDNARVDLQDKVFGRARFIHDLRWPDMRHGRVVRAPSLTAQLSGLPTDLLGQIPTDVQCWADGSFVAVVAQQEHLAHTWSERVASALTWQLPEQLPTQHNLPEFLRQAEHQTTLPFQKGQADWAAQAELSGQRFELSLIHI